MKKPALLLSTAFLCVNTVHGEEVSLLAPQPQVAAESVSSSTVVEATSNVAVVSQEPKKFRVGAHVSSLGFGPDLTYQFNPYIKMGISGNYFELERKKTLKITGRKNGHTAKVSVPTTGNLRLFSAGLLIDVHPFGGCFYLRGGAFYNGNQLTVKARPHNEDVELNGQVYNFGVSGYGAGKVHFNRIAPYLGLGFDWGFESASITLDAGVLFQGKAKAKVTALEGIRTNLGLTYTVQPKDILNFERQVEKEVNKHKLLQYYPVIALGVHFKF